MRRLLVALALGLAIFPGTAASTASASAGAQNVPALGHVFVIIGENTDYSHVTATNSPYTMLTLRPQSAWMSRYFAATHWSQANYVALMSGQFNHCQQQDGGIACHQDVDNLYHQLDLAGIGWKTWLEDEGARCGNLVPNDTTETLAATDCVPHGNCPLVGFYTTGNPPINYDNIEGVGGVWSATAKSQECLDNDIYAGDAADRPMYIFDNALAAGEVPNFNLVLPNGCEDGEANCKPLNDRIRQFDAFLEREIPKIKASPAFGSDGVIIVTYDEDQRKDGMAKKNDLGSGGPVACFVISPLVHPGEYGGSYYHYSVLRTIEDGFGIGNHLAHAGDVSPITAIWR
jgi:hypothetical protein